MALGPFAILFISLAAAALFVAGAAAIYRVMNPTQFDRFQLPISENQRAYMRHLRSRTVDQYELDQQHMPQPPQSPITSTQYQSTHMS